MIPGSSPGVLWSRSGLRKHNVRSVRFPERPRMRFRDPPALRNDAAGTRRRARASARAAFERARRLTVKTLTCCAMSPVLTGGEGGLMWAPHLRKARARNRSVVFAPSASAAARSCSRPWSGAAPSSPAALTTLKPLMSSTRSEVLSRRSLARVLSSTGTARAEWQRLYDSRRGSSRTARQSLLPLRRCSCEFFSRLQELRCLTAR